MRTRTLFALLMLVAAVSGAAAQTAPTITPVPANAVKVTDTFWAPRLEINRTVTLPQLLQRIAEAGGVDAFERASLTNNGQPNDGVLPANAWQDAEVYKVIEASSWSLLSHPDAELNKKLDTIILTIAAAQEKDGYLYTPRTIKPAQPLAAAGQARWVNEKADSYELYNLGCLMQAAAIHHRATGKESLLAVAKKAADLLDQTFGPAPKQAIWPGHPGIESALIALARETNTPRYAALAKFFLDQRGPDPASATATSGPATARGVRGGGAAARGPGATYTVAQSRFIDQTQAAGHAPTAIQLYLAAADLHDPVYAQTLDKIYGNLVQTKLYATGAPAADNTGVFPRNYNLSSVNAYSSTDTAANFITLNERLFQAKGDARYIDELEHTLYNALLAGISIDGKTFFDTQPLEFAPIGPVTGRGGARATRRESFNTAFSPIAAARTLAQLPEFLYAHSADALYINLYAQSSADVRLANNRSLRIDQATQYPQLGSVRITFTPDQPFESTFHIRIPAWARAQSSELYALRSQPEPRSSPEALSLKLNGQSVPIEVVNGYVPLKRKWSAGDTLELHIPMPPLKVKANDQVADAKNRLALKRGPLVYALEATDNNGKVRNLVLPADAPLSSSLKPDLLGGITILTGTASTLTVDDKDQPARTETTLTAIPYYAWANRGPSEMTTWIAAENAAAVATSKPTLIATARLSASPRSDGPTNPQACRDGIEPRASADNSPLSHFDWWPSTNGKEEWVQAEWTQAQTLTSTSVYWWDDTGVGECRPPTSWKALYKDDGGNWQPVPTADKFAIDKDKYNRITFTTPIKTTALRLECVMPNSPGTQRLSVGIQEWKIR